MMPILHIKALGQSDPLRITPALKATSVAISDVYGCSPEHVWVTWQEIQPGLYVEGEKSVDIQPENTHPPICELICFEGKSSDEIEKVLSITASTLSRELGIENNIFITYREVKSGQVIAGNGIVTKKN